MKSKVFKSVNIIFVLIIFFFYCLTVREKGYIVCIGLLSACSMFSAVLMREKITYFSDENIYEIIHDIKTPAVAELRTIELLLKGNFGSVNGLQKDILMQMHNSARFMLDVVNDISALCSYEHENIKWSYEVFEINGIVKMCMENLKYQSAEKRCAILFDYGEEQICVLGVKTEITRVLFNLLTNAVKYSYPDRIITVATKIADNKCVFTVNSFGETFDKTCIKRYNSIKGTGNGLGLYICDLILKKHNCKMLIESDEKSGNCFGFELELASQSVGKAIA